MAEESPVETTLLVQLDGGVWVGIRVVHRECFGGYLPAAVGLWETRVAPPPVAPPPGCVACHLWRQGVACALVLTPFVTEQVFRFSRAKYS